MFNYFLFSFISIFVDKCCIKNIIIIWWKIQLQKQIKDLMKFKQLQTQFQILQTLCRNCKEASFIANNEWLIYMIFNKRHILWYICLTPE